VDICPCLRAEVTKKARKETYSDKLGARPDHLRCHIDMEFCLPDSLRAIVLSLKFRQNRLIGFRDIRSRNSPFPITLVSGL